MLEWVTARELEDDRLVALSLAFRMYADAGKPVGWLKPLRAAVTADTELMAWLDERLNPPISEERPRVAQKTRGA